MDLYELNQYRKKLLYKYIFFIFSALFLIFSFFMGWSEVFYEAFKNLLNVIFSKNEEWRGVFFILYFGLIFLFFILAGAIKQSYDNQIRFRICQEILNSFGVVCKKANQSIFDRKVIEYFADDFDDMDFSYSHIIKGKNFIGQYFSLTKEVSERDSDGNIKRYDKNVLKGYIFEFQLDRNYEVFIVIEKNKFHLSDLLPIVYDKERVKLDNVEFEKKFDVYSDNQINARFYLNHKRMENLLGLNNDLPIIIDNDIAFWGIKMEPVYLMAIPFFRKITKENIKNIEVFYRLIESVYEKIK